MNHSGTLMFGRDADVRVNPLASPAARRRAVASAADVHGWKAAPEAMPDLAEHPGVQEQMDPLNRKLDFMVEELEHQRRHRLEMQDFKEDLTLVAKDVCHAAVAEFEDVSEPARIHVVFERAVSVGADGRHAPRARPCGSATRGIA